jgi:hypothetical protein
VPPVHDVLARVQTHHVCRRPRGKRERDAEILDRRDRTAEGRGGARYLGRTRGDSLRSGGAPLLADRERVTSRASERQREGGGEGEIDMYL